MQLDAPWNLSIGLDQERGSPRLSSQQSQHSCSRSSSCCLASLSFYIALLRMWTIWTPPSALPFVPAEYLEGLAGMWLPVACWSAKGCSGSSKEPKRV